MNIGFKVQNLAVAEPTAETLVITHEFTPPTDISIKKRGHLFITLTLKSSTDQSLNQKAKLFLDSIQENFYHINEDTPLRALEKSLERSVQIINDNNEIQINFATSLIWNRVLYTSYMGLPAIYLIRGSGVRNLVTTHQPKEIWTNSGILDNEDVLIIGTDAFQKEFPAQEIMTKLGNLSSSISQSKLKNELGAMLIKISIDEKNPNNIKEKGIQLGLKATISNALTQFKNKFSQNESLSDRFKIYQNKKSAPVSSISGLLNNTSTLQNISPISINSKRISSNKSVNKIRGKTILGILMVSAITFVVYSVAFSSDRSAKTSPGDFILNSKSKQDKQELIMGSSNNQIDIPNLHNVFYDLSNKDNKVKQILPIDITSYKNDVFILDAVSKSVYRIENDTKEINAISENLESAEGIKCSDQICYIYGSNTLYLLDPQKPSEPTKSIMDIDKILDASPYLSNLYILSKDNIHTIGNNETESKIWLKNDMHLDQAKSFAIDGNIYVLENRTVNKYLNGEKIKNFNFDDAKIIDPIKIMLIGEKLIVLEADNSQKSLFIYNKNSGEFVEEIKLAEEINPHKPISFTIQKDLNNKILFIMDKAIYEVEY